MARRRLRVVIERQDWTVWTSFLWGFVTSSGRRWSWLHQLRAHNTLFCEYQIHDSLLVAASNGKLPCAIAQAARRRTGASSCDVFRSSGSFVLGGQRVDSIQHQEAATGQAPHCRRLSWGTSCVCVGNDVGSCVQGTSSTGHHASPAQSEGTWASRALKCTYSLRIPRSHRQGGTEKARY